MLQHLHVKNLALIQEAEIDFTEGLNILTGETGAGKSLLIGSVQLALGGKVSRDLIRSGADYALAELVFSVDRKEELEKLLALELEPEDGQLILSRKITEGKSINKINGMTVTAGQLKEVASVLLDLHGQHEHQTLLQKRNHLEIVDAFAKEELGEWKSQLKEAYRIYLQIKEQLENSLLDESTRKKEADFLEFEIREIQLAALRPGEDEELEEQYRRLSHAQKITEAVSNAYAELGYGERTAAGERIGHALRELLLVASYDGRLGELTDQLSSLDALLNDLNRELSDYLMEIDAGMDALAQIEERLNTINHLKAKYGKSVETILQYLAKSEKRLEELEHYDEYVFSLQKELAAQERELERLCSQISAIRQKAADQLAGKIKDHLIDLNFLDVSFAVTFQKLDRYSANGWDEAEFLISVNPGEEPKSLVKVASGGELSRIMLAIKTVLADRDEIGSVIFDEIDVGISGRTAQKVSEKMALISKSRQVICITHLAQIAAQADSHFLLEKQTVAGGTHTVVRKLDQEESIEELARILGGAEITDIVRSSAREMKLFATAKKC